MDPSFGCSASLEVNHPAWSYPVFALTDQEVCTGDVVNIGQPPIAGYTYAWMGPNNFISAVSDPAVSVSIESGGTYTVVVTDGASSCSTTSEMTLTINDPLANAGQDWIVCSNAIVELGVPDPSGGEWTYNWSPANPPWENGTDNTSDQPQKIVTIDLTFSVTVTDSSSGCIATDEVDIIVDDNPVVTDAPDEIICLGDKVQIGAPALQGVTYSWSPTAGLSDPTAAQPFASPSTSTTYTVTAIFLGDCLSNATDDVTVTVIDPTFDLGADISYCPSSGGVSIGNNAPTTDVSFYNLSSYLG